MRVVAVAHDALEPGIRDERQQLVGAGVGQRPGRRDPHAHTVVEAELGQLGAARPVQVGEQGLVVDVQEVEDDVVDLDLVDQRGRRVEPADQRFNVSRRG
ncbi:hypothetical protein ACFVAV_30235 [Nocardia sp. NPDC057663]|uniref:hypothetical protein n=1 Tax=Nocardia sp. NPDC057663 TaxID=3346201 RepID=UPI003670A46C